MPDTITFTTTSTAAFIDQDKCGRIKLNWHTRKCRIGRVKNKLGLALTKVSQAQKYCPHICPHINKNRLRTHLKRLMVPGRRGLTMMQINVSRHFNRPGK